MRAKGRRSTSRIPEGCRIEVGARGPFQMIDLRKTGHGRHSDMTKRNGTRQHSQSYAMFSRPLTFRLVPSSLYFVELDKVNYADSACIILESIELCDYGDAGDHQVVRLTEVMYQGDA